MSVSGGTSIAISRSVARSYVFPRDPSLSQADLLIIADEKPLRRKAAKSNLRPAGKVREVFDRVSKLPRRQQEHIVNYVSQYEQSRQ